MENYQYQIIVIGSGSAGRDAALLAGRAGLSTLLVEGNSLGGSTFHRGCYAVRALRACATQFSQLTKGDRLGVFTDLVSANLVHWLEVQRLTSSRLTKELTLELEQAQVTLRFGHAKIVGPNEVELSFNSVIEERVSAQHIIVATGSRPIFGGNEKARIVNTDQFLRNTQIPAHLLVVGGGYIGCELAAIYRALGCRVTLVETESRLLADWDVDAGRQIQHTLTSAGVEVHLDEKIDLETLQQPTRSHVQLRNGTLIDPDLILVATGRTPNLEGLGLTSVGLPEQGPLAVDAQMRTAVPSIYAIGDVNGLGMLDSVASAQARVAVNTIRGISSVYSSHWIPRCLHTHPPIAAAGWTEAEANAAGHEVVIFTENLFLQTDDDTTVVQPGQLRIKLVVQSGSHRILGCLAIGAEAAEILNLVSTAIRFGLTATQLTELSLVHPSASEALVRLLQSRFDTARSRV
ncbi:MAG: NAD(P)/FAD-dependent oxidoreductase [Verrucomicrobia bacterium]|nr:NAD(P)/FAD-dependent oxidoreductase [Verrucomicrobiota bacterium]